MSSTSFSGHRGPRSLAGISIDEAQVFGMGGAVYPRLVVQPKLDYWPLDEKCVAYAFAGLDAQLKGENAGKLADALPVRLWRVQHTHQHYVGPETLTMEFPLDARRIREMERQRDGKDLSLHIDFQLTVEDHRQIPGTQKEQRPPTWGIESVARLTAQLQLKIPRTIWIEKVLPNIGYGVVHLVELPAVRIESCRALTRSYVALCQAQRLHAEGFYDMAVARCRTALDPFFTSVPVDPNNKDSRRKPELERSWQTRLGSATYTWLNEIMTAIKSAANPTVHLPDAHYDQFESQMIQAITTTLVAYAARTMQSDEKK